MHSRAGTRAGIAMILAVVLAIVLHNQASILVVIVGAIGAGFFFQRWRNEAAQATTSTCESVGPAVAYLGFSGTVNSFEMKTNYAGAFVRANHKKLVNESHEMRRFLESVAPELRSTKTQRPRRFES